MEESEERDIDDRQHEEERGRIAEEEVQLGECEEEEDAARDRIGPESLAPERSDDAHLDEPVHEQIGRGEELLMGGKPLEEVQQRVREEVLRILMELFTQQHLEEPVQGCGREEEQQRPAEQLEDTVDELDEDACFECIVQDCWSPEHRTAERESS